MHSLHRKELRSPQLILVGAEESSTGGAEVTGLLYLRRWGTPVYLLSHILLSLKFQDHPEATEMRYIPG